MSLLLVFYDNACPNCTHFMRFCTRYDKARRISFQPLRHSMLPLELSERAHKGIASLYKNKWYFGFPTLCLIIYIIPLFRWIYPLAYLLRVSGIGGKLYNYLAAKRRILSLHCTPESCPNN